MNEFMNFYHFPGFLKNGKLVSGNGPF